MSKALACLVWCVSFNVQAAVSLCTPAETDYFSCQLASGDIVSLCGNVVSHDGFNADPLLADNPWLQFRRGLTRVVATSFPESSAVDVFVGQSTQTMFGSIDNIVFRKGNRAYSIEHRASGGLKKTFTGVVTASPGYYGLDVCNSASCFRNKRMERCVSNPFFGKSGDEFFMLVRRLMPEPRTAQ